MPIRTRFAIAAAVAAVCLAIIKARFGLGPLVYVPQGILLISVVYVIAIGADWLVESATRIARRLGVSDLVIGLTIVAFGTSAPELAASLSAGFQGNGDIAVANVVGSNVFNLCFILGGVALLTKGGLPADRDLIIRDGPVLLAGTLLLFLFIGGTSSSAAPPAAGSGWFQPLNLRLERGEGFILVGALAAYLFVLYRVFRAGLAKRVHATVPTADEQASSAGEATEGATSDDTQTEGSRPGYDWLLLLVGLCAVVGGCHLLVGSATVSGGSVTGHGALWFARMWGVPDYIIGVTIIAAGTSAPEFIVSLVAASRGSFGISAGNLLGSDIFNMFGVLGVSGVLIQQPIGPPVSVSPAVIPSLVALTGVVAISIFFMWTGRRVSRLEGLALILIGVGRWYMDFTAR